MRFDTKRFAFALAAAWAVWYAICSLLVAVAPAQTQAVFSFAMHYELTGARSLSWASFFGGLILTTASVAIFAATVGGSSTHGSVPGLRADYGPRRAAEVSRDRPVPKRAVNNGPARAPLAAPTASVLACGNVGAIRSLRGYQHSFTLASWLVGRE
jgi:hypothetical protein